MARRLVPVKARCQTGKRLEVWDRALVVKHDSFRAPNVGASAIGPLLSCSVWRSFASNRQRERNDCVTTVVRGNQFQGDDVGQRPSKGQRVIAHYVLRLMSELLREPATDLWSRSAVPGGLVGISPWGSLVESHVVVARIGARQRVVWQQETGTPTTTVITHNLLRRELAQ